LKVVNCQTIRLTIRSLSLKPCPHCHRKRRLSQKTATVAEFGDSKFGDKVSPKSATVWTGF